MSSSPPTRIRDRADQFRWVLALAFLVLVGAFFRTQVLQQEKYRLRSESNRLRAIPLAAPRGALLDRNGLVIADNGPGYTVKLLSPSEDSLRAVLSRLGEVVPLDIAPVEQVVRRWRSARYQPALVFNSQSFETIARLEEHRPSLPGLVIQTEPRRLYPAGRAVAHIVGYVGEVSEDDLDKKRFPGARLGTIVGKEGLEQQYDSVLRGREGVKYVEVNARGAMVREEVSSPSIGAEAGQPLKTTIDLPLQQYIDSLWGDSIPYRGALVAMNPKGEILALYSWPSFDPNDFVGGISGSRYRELTSDSAGLPLYNRAIKGAYPPASPFKLATAAMALRRGIVTFTTHMDQPCRGGLRFGNRVFKCWKKEGHGSLDLTGAIAASCDVYFYQLGLKLGLDHLLEDGVSLGFRERSGIDLGSESRSFPPRSRAWYDSTYGPRGWTNAVTLNLSIGQGENSQTLINVMKFYQALAGDGNTIPPHMIAVEKGVTTRSLGLDPAQLQGLRDAMIAVVQRGTAAASRGKDLNVAGKTGTAQNPHGADHGWFIGFAPADKPEIIVGSIMEKALHGSSVAPWVVRIIRRYLESQGKGSDVPIQIFVPEDSAPRAEDVPAVDSVVKESPMRSRGPDRMLLLFTGLLLLYGLLVLYSAGQTDTPTNAAGAWTRQLVWVGVASVAGFLAFQTSPRILEWISPGIYAGALVLLLITLVIGTGAGSAAGTRSWLEVGGVRIGQPAEFAKLATVLFLARYLSTLREPPDSLRGLIPACMIAGVPMLLVLKQPDLGSAIVFAGILFAMLFWAGVRPGLLLLLASPAISLLLAANTALWAGWMLLLFVLLVVWRVYVSEGVLIYLVNSAMGVVALVVWNKLKPYQQKRITAFINPELDPGGASYQALQSKVAHGSGGMFGTGYTEGPQKRMGFLPEQHTDFIFPIVGEELGFVGILVALGLFLGFFLTLLRIARRATDPFGGLVVFGVLGLLFTHMWENIGMTVNLMPITGIPLPFFSYGGSFMISTGLALGLTLRVAWESRLAGYAD